jgi:hypothetical protein
MYDAGIKVAAKPFVINNNFTTGIEEPNWKYFPYFLPYRYLKK